VKGVRHGRSALQSPEGKFAEVLHPEVAEYFYSPFMSTTMDLGLNAILSNFCDC
jgi:hypothetical protein